MAAGNSQGQAMEAELAQGVPPPPNLSAAPTNRWANGPPKDGPQPTQPVQRPTSRVTSAVALILPKDFESARDLRFLLKEIDKAAPDSVTHADISGLKLTLSIVTDDVATRLDGMKVHPVKGKTAHLFRIPPPTPPAKYALRALNMPRGYTVDDAVAAITEDLGGVDVRVLPHTVSGFKNIYLPTATILANAFTKPAQRSFRLYGEDVILLDIRLGDNMNADNAGKKAREEHRVQREMAIKAEADALAAEYQKEQAQLKKKQEKQKQQQQQQQQSPLRTPQPRQQVQPLRAPQLTDANSSVQPNQPNTQQEHPQVNQDLVDDLVTRNSITDTVMSEFFDALPRVQDDERAYKLCATIIANVAEERKIVAHLDRQFLSRPMLLLEATMLRKYQERLSDVSSIMTRIMPSSALVTRKRGAGASL
jgi:hypothetical protein